MAGCKAGEILTLVDNISIVNNIINNIKKKSNIVWTSMTGI